jgi:hypothetical protein
MWVLEGQTFLTLNAGCLLHHSPLIWKNNTVCIGFWLGQRKYLPTARTLYKDVIVKSNSSSMCHRLKVCTLQVFQLFCIPTYLVGVYAYILTSLPSYQLLLNLEQNSFPNFTADIQNDFSPRDWKKQLSINIADFTLHCSLFNSQCVMNLIHFYCFVFVLQSFYNWHIFEVF